MNIEEFIETFNLGFHLDIVLVDENGTEYAVQDIVNENGIMVVDITKRAYGNIIWSPLDLYKKMKPMKDTVKDVICRNWSRKTFRILGIKRDYSTLKIEIAKENTENE